MVVENTSTIDHGVTSHRRSIIPNAVTGTFTADDTSNHDFRVNGLGKGRFVVAVDNPANQALTVTVYGMHGSAGNVGDVGTFQIGSFTVATADKGYEALNDPFPWYLVRIVYAIAPTDDPLTTCTVHIDMSAF